MLLADLLNIPQFKDFELITNGAGLHRTIHNINMMDAPDITNYLQKNDLLVTSGFHLKDDEQLFIELITSMNRMQCAGIGIKTDRFLRKVPNELVNLANQLAFNIFIIPGDIPLVEVVHTTILHLSSVRTEELCTALDTKKRFTEMMINGDSTKDVLESLSSMTQTSYVLVNPYFQIMSTSGHTSRMEHAISSLKSTFIGRFAPSVSEQFSISYVKTRTVYTFFTIQVSNNQKCYLISDKNAGHSLSLLLVEQAATVIAFEYMKQSALCKMKESAKNEFFSNLIDGHFSSEKDVNKHAAEFSIPHEQLYLLSYGKCDIDESLSTYIQHKLETAEIYTYIHQKLNEYQLQDCFFLKENGFVILFSVSSGLSSTNNYVKEFLSSIQNEVVEIFQTTVSFGISTMYEKIIEMEKAYKEATEAFMTAEASKMKAFLQTYQAKDYADMLRFFPTEEAQEFCNRMLLDLANPESEDVEQLVQTLFVYLECHGQIAETAKRLYVHRNTVIYRIEKCEKMIGQNVKDPEVTFRLRLALRMKQFLNQSTFV